MAGSEDGYPLVYQCTLSTCITFKCSGKLHLLPAVRAVLVGPTFLQGVWTISKVCQSCKVEWGPWDTNAQCDVEAHHGVCLTLTALEEGVRQLTERSKSLSEVASYLVDVATRSLLCGTPPGLSATTTTTNPIDLPKILAGLELHVRKALLSHLHLRISPLLGKVTCPHEGCAPPMLVVDGTQHHITDLLKAADRGTAELRELEHSDSIHMGFDMGVDQSSWSTSVVAALREGTKVKSTSTGQPAFGPPRPGGQYAFEEFLLPFMLENIMESAYNPNRVPRQLRTRYRSADVPCFVPLAARADEQRSGAHLKKSRSAAEQALSEALAPYDGVFATFFLAVPGLQEAAQHNLNSAKNEDLLQWYADFKEVVNQDGFAARNANFPAGHSPRARRVLGTAEPQKKKRKAAAPQGAFQVSD